MMDKDNSPLFTMTLDVVALNKIYITDSKKRADITEAIKEQLQRFKENYKEEIIIGKTEIIKQAGARTKRGSVIYKKGDYFIEEKNLTESKIKAIKKALMERLAQKEYGIRMLPKEVQSLLEDFWQKNSTLLLTGLKVLSDAPETSNRDYYESCYSKLTSRDYSKFTVVISDDEEKDGLGKTDVAEYFMRHLLKHPLPKCEEWSDKENWECINLFLQTDVSKGPSGLGILLSEAKFKEQENCDKEIKKQPGKENSVLASDRYRDFKYKDEDGNEIEYYVSTQWGGLYNSSSNSKNQTFSRLWKKINDYNANEGKDNQFVVKPSV